MAEMTKATITLYDGGFLLALPPKYPQQDKATPYYGHEPSVHRVAATWREAASILDDIFADALGKAR
jgi:hypothetical protein